MANLYKYYEDLDFTSSDSPVVLDLESDLTALATAGEQTANSLSFVNPSSNKVQFEISFDGSTYGDPIEVDGGGSARLNKSGIKKLRITHLGEDSAYRVYAFADKNADAYFQSTAKVTNGGLDVNIQDQHTPALDSLFAQSVPGGNFTLAADTIASTVTTLVYTFTATAGHGIIIGDEIILLDVIGSRSFYAEVMNVAVDVITVDRPIDHVFLAASTLGRRVTTEMAVDGSVTPQIFSIRAGDIPLDATRFMITMTSASAMDDSKFGSLAKLSRGLVLRIVNSFQKTMLCFKSNQEIKQFCFDLAYADKSPAGENGLSARLSYGGQDKHGVTLRISTGDVIQWIVQDDLTGLLSMKISAQGHEVE
jgi:hypothetical protein